MKEILIEEITNENIKKYKSLKYKKTKFIYNGTDEDSQKIVEALNIKNKFERVKFIFDETCAKIDKELADKNFCDFQCNQCIAQRKSNTDATNGCCRMCKFQSTNGCKTKNLTCKLFYCDEIKKNYKVLEFKDLKLLNLLNFRQKTILKFNLFSSREDIILDLYIGSIIVSACRQFLTLINMLHFLLFKYPSNSYNNALNKKYIILLILSLIVVFATYQPIMLLSILLIGFLHKIIKNICISMKKLDVLRGYNYNNLSDVK